MKPCTVHGARQSRYCRTIRWCINRTGSVLRNISRNSRRMIYLSSTVHLNDTSTSVRTSPTSASSSLRRQRRNGRVSRATSQPFAVVESPRRNSITKWWSSSWSRLNNSSESSMTPAISSCVAYLMMNWSGQRKLPDLSRSICR